MAVARGDGEAARRDEARRARYDGGDDGRVLVACRRRSQAPSLRVPPPTLQSAILCPATTPSGVLPRQLLIPPGSYPHGVLKWNEQDAVTRDEVAHSEKDTETMGRLEIATTSRDDYFCQNLFFCFFPLPLFLIFSFMLKIQMFFFAYNTLLRIIKRK